MEVVEEMKKLRELLDKKGIDWEDNSEDSEAFTDLWICRTRFKFNGLEVSCINGRGTYGGFYGCNPDDGNMGLLEAWIEGFEPIGWQTADEVIEKLERMKRVSEREKDATIN